MGDAFYSPSPFFYFFWRQEHSLVMEGVSVTCDLPFEPGPGGEGKICYEFRESVWIALPKCGIVWKFRMFVCNPSPNECHCWVYRADTLLDAWLVWLLGDGRGWLALGGFVLTGGVGVPVYRYTAAFIVL